MKFITSFNLFENLNADFIRDQLSNSSAWNDLVALQIPGFKYEIKRNGTIDFGRSIGSHTKISIEKNSDGTLHS